MYKHITTFLLAVFLATGLCAQQMHETLQQHNHDNGDFHKCHTEEVDQRLRNQFPEMGTRAQFEAWLAPKVRAYKRDVAEGRNARAVLTVPIIFHIVHNGTAVGSGANISATYVNAQIEQLNNDFRKIMGTSGNNTNPVGADTELQFCAALVDPSGNILAEPGINRIDRNARGWAAPNYDEGYIDGTIKPQSYWDPTKYVNIWALELTSSLLGYAQYPNMSGVGGLGSNNGPANTDGVVIQYYSVGSTTTPFPSGAPYNLGRTLTHELGHFLGLLHTFQGGCSVNNDYCDDTPRTSAPSFGCPVGRTSCSGMLTMIENYMDYTDDDCMNIFTLDQKARIQAVMMNSPRRMELVNSTACANCALPSISCPATWNACPGSSIAPAVTGAATAQDCQGNTLSVTYSDMEVSTGLAPGESVIQRTWTSAPDGLGNTATCVQTINRNDVTTPTVIVGSIAACYATVAAAEAAALAATTATDNCATTLTETASTTGACSATITVTTSDGYGNSTLRMYSTRIDNIAPVVTQGSIAACYATIAAAEAAALAATTATDNCTGILTETASTTGTCAVTITVTTTDGCGNSTPVTYSTRIDNTAPVVTTGTIATCYQTVAAAEAAALAATTATDNCPGTLTETASTTGTCTATVTVTTTDGCGNSTPVTYSTRIDNTPPTLVCRTNTIVLNQAGTYTLQAADVLNTGSSTDNCGIYTVTNINPPVLNCTHAGTVVAVTVTAADPCGNTSTCVANITVQKGSGLPSPYVNSEIGTSGQIPGTATYDPCDKIFTVTSTGFSTNLGDDVHSAHQTLCGNSSLTAHVLSVQNGWGGIMMRESVATGSKKVALKVDFAPGGSNSLIREVRSATNGVEQQQNFPIPPGETWLRLTRTGNIFQGWSSSDGVNWSVRFSVTLAMNNCLLTGMFAEAYNANTVATATFGSVTTTGAGPVVPLVTDHAQPTADHGFKLENVHLFPNPTNGLVTAALNGLEGQTLRIGVFNALGQPVWLREIEKVAESTETIDLSDQLSGIYWVRIHVADGSAITRRLLLTR